MLDFLADHIDYDYTVSQIQDFTEISRPTIYRLIEELEGEKMIYLTREVGASKFYRLDTRNDKVVRMLQLEFEAINKSLVQEQLRVSPAGAQRREGVSMRAAIARARNAALRMSRRSVAPSVKFKKSKKTGHS